MSLRLARTLSAAVATQRARGARSSHGERDAHRPRGPDSQPHRSAVFIHGQESIQALICGFADLEARGFAVVRGWVRPQSSHADRARQTFAAQLSSAAAFAWGFAEKQTVS